MPQPHKDIPRPPAPPTARLANPKLQSGPVPGHQEPVCSEGGTEPQTWREAASPLRPLCRAILIGDPFIWEPGLRAGLAWPLPTPPSINLVTNSREAARQAWLLKVPQQMPLKPYLPPHQAPGKSQTAIPGHLLPPAVPGDALEHRSSPGSEPSPLTCGRAAWSGGALGWVRGAAPRPLQPWQVPPSPLGPWSPAEGQVWSRLRPWAGGEATVCGGIQAVTLRLAG